MASPVAFTDEEFELAAREVNNPDLNEYEKLVESQGTTIYRHYIEVRGVGFTLFVLVVQVKGLYKHSRSEHLKH